MLEIESRMLNLTDAADTMGHNDSYSCKQIELGGAEDMFSSIYPPRPVNAVITMLACFSVLGLIGNSLVLYVYVRKRNKLSSTVFIIALAATDLVTSAVSMPYTMVVESLNYTVSLDFSCKLYYFFITCTVPFSVFIMVAIAIDRYICICRPHSHVLDSVRARNCVICLLFLAIIMGIVTAMSMGVYVDMDTLRTPTIKNMIKNNFAEENFTTLLKRIEDESCPECVNTSFIDEDTMSRLVANLVALHLKVCSRVMPTNETFVYTGKCMPNQMYVSEHFRRQYQTFYSSSFLVCFFVVFVLYILIYRSVLVRRSRRLAARTKTTITHTQDVSLTENQSMLNDSPDKSIALAEITNGKKDAGSQKKRPQPQSQNQSLLQKDQAQHDIEEGAQTAAENGCLRDKYFLANFRTAVMLFVVTIFFVIAYLPSWLIAYKVLKFNVLVFYVYFSNHIVNPIIYAFMNPAFRRSLKGLLCRKRGRGM
ncbi:trissin receptor-like [Physella acuta]|uniref:trissin receptor-like n=1 Tax=Physella acuta TaxID=109671 RepID=UPI0027DCFC71|nr:trissin receptor-like [Physella acuta]XP_059147225.1 trissin receptor-like [Physella acuta]